jgi:hypothetical protein
MLTYDIIIKHLMPPVNNFSLQPNIVMKSVDFSFFNKLFDETFYRYGINSEKSLINSINYCLSTNIELPNNIKDIIKLLDVNIIIFDFKNNKIMMEYNNDFFNPWKPSIFLANYDDWWEPIISKDTKIFSFSSSKANILKNNILHQQITRINGENININDNFQEIIDIEGFNKLIQKDEEEYNNEAFIIEKPTKVQLNKMKKDELLELCKNLNKTITKKSTKKDLIDIILL